jgi:hypothetical protein
MSENGWIKCPSARSRPSNAEQIPNELENAAAVTMMVTCMLWRFLVPLFFLYLVPVALSAGSYLFGRRHFDWRSANRSSAGLLPPPSQRRHAVVRVFSARTVSWRGIVATHSWVVIKDKGAAAYQRFDYTAWGRPIWIDRFEPDGRWFGSAPEVIFACDGEDAERMLPRIRETVRHYRYSRVGDYRSWPGPNSNTFVAAIMSAVPEMKASLAATAIGKDFPSNGRWIGLAPSRTGIRITADGYVGLTLAWIEGLEVNILGAVVGLDLRGLGLKLPGLGSVSFPTAAVKRVIRASADKLAIGLRSVFRLTTNSSRRL